MDMVDVSLADRPEVSEALANAQVGDEVTASVTLKVNELGDENATFDIVDFILDNVTASELPDEQTTSAEPVAPAAPAEPNAANLLFGQ